MDGDDSFLLNGDERNVCDDGTGGVVSRGYGREGGYGMV